MSENDQIESKIKLIREFRYETDETKLPSEFQQLIHPAGGEIQLGYYENAIVNGMELIFWEFTTNSKWKDLLEALQTTHIHCSEIVNIHPNDISDTQ